MKTKTKELIVHILAMVVMLLIGLFYGWVFFAPDTPYIEAEKMLEIKGASGTCRLMEAKAYAENESETIFLDEDGNLWAIAKNPAIHGKSYYMLLIDTRDTKDLKDDKILDIYAEIDMQGGKPNGN